MTKISAVINTINEEENLPRAIASIRGLVDEIVVVDMHSDDKTAEVAKKLGARVYKHKRTGYVEPARNFAISKTTGSWVFVIDADEEIPASLKSRIKGIARKPEADYYRLPRKNYIFGKWMRYSKWWPDYNIRFFKKGSVSWSEVIHSVPITTGKGLDLEPVKEYAIIHHHYKTVEQYIDRLNRYTSVHAANKKKEGYSFVWSDLLTKPAGEFLGRYFQAEGYKDGVHGLALSGLQAFSELVLYIKIWQMEKFEKTKIDTKKVIEKMKEIEKDLSYWQAETLVKETGSVVNRFKRKFKLR